MNPYSQDLREKIIQALEAQEERQSYIAGRFAVSLSFVEKNLASMADNRQLCRQASR
jgi:transposase